tara:strand:- start:1341 stop:1523 length:183 start_codon:yes stop_codon:yes gene_type:complete
MKVGREYYVEDSYQCPECGGIFPRTPMDEGFEDDELMCDNCLAWIILGVFPESGEFIEKV